jgi:phage shock protein A
MEMDDLRKLMADLMAAHRETEHHVVRMMERQSDIEAMMREMNARSAELEKLTKHVVENNMSLSRIIAAHDYDIDELDARLKRLEERHGRGRQ